MKTSKKAAKSPVKRGRGPVAVAEVTPRVARRERRRERSREEILEAARRVLLRQGIVATTLEAVAKEVGVTKAALYYYYPSKDALFFELIFGTLEAHARSVHEAVVKGKTGGEGLRAIIGETVRSFAPRLDDFRLAFLHNQVAGPGLVPLSAGQLERIRPLNDLLFAGTTSLLREEWKRERGRAAVEPRLMAFLAHLAALGLLTMKGMVEAVGDPLVYSDDQLIDGLSRVFEAAARP